jgi:hypothetical protein
MASLLFAGGALLTKETAVAIPALIFLLECWRDDHPADAPPDKIWKRAAWAAAAYVPLTVVYLIVRALVVPSLPPGKLSTLFLAGYHLIPAIAGRYVVLLFVPWPMAMCYDLGSLVIPLVGLGIAAVWAAIAWKAQWLRRDILFSAALASSCLFLPVATSPLMIRDFQVQDRYAYLATTGACLAVAILLNAMAARWLRRYRDSLLFLCVALVSLAGAATLRQQHVWQSEEALWANAHQVTPSSERASFQLFVELLREKRPAEALQACQATAPYHPEEKELQDCLGLSKLGVDYLQKHGQNRVVPVE